jgi:hypothetical protein
MGLPRAQREVQLIVALQPYSHPSNLPHSFELRTYPGQAANLAE